MLLTRFDIDIAKCMYCGLCSEVCPTGSIHHTTEFEGSDFSLESMIRRFVKAPVVAYKAKKDGETDPVIAPILERGMRYIQEFAEPADMKKVKAEEKAAAAYQEAAAAILMRAANTRTFAGTEEPPIMGRIPLPKRRPITRP